jgi:hypothetical protein
MPLHEGEKYRCDDCNAQVTVIRSSDTRSLDFEVSGTAAAPDPADGLERAGFQPRLFCCGKAMVRFCIRAAS